MKLELPIERLYVKLLSKKLGRSLNQKEVQEIKTHVANLDTEIVIDEPETRAEQLESMVDAGVAGVRVMSERDDSTCDFCYQADGGEYPIEDAIRGRVLPHKGCTNRTCRCVYFPLLELSPGARR